jgi:hypothetical protein
MKYQGLYRLAPELDLLQWYLLAEIIQPADYILSIISLLAES